MQVILPDPAGVPIFSWCPDAEEKAMAQIRSFSGLPFVRHLAMMPDAHFGNTICVGGVVACEGVVVPDAVGVDGGCGMCTVKTSLKAEDFPEAARWRYLERIEKIIPVGFAHNDNRRIALLRQTMQDKFAYDMSRSGISDSPFQPVQDIEKAYFDQIGTLGSGNHMAEVDLDNEGNVWLLMHSGSRNIGKRICDYFNEVASVLDQKYYTSVPEKIAFLPTDSLEGKSYLAWMDFALRFAFRNRQVMLDGMEEAFMAEFPNITFDKPINIHHNYAALERHFGKDLWVHRKGATLASEGTMGIIPGSMGTATYIVRGLGNPQSLNSCSHGAGRAHGRMDFNKSHNTVDALAEIEKSMEGVVYRKFGKEVNRKGKETGFLDVAEAPSAYKDIEVVLANEADLVEPLVKLKPIVVMKG